MLRIDETPDPAGESSVAMEQLGEQLSSLRLCWPKADERMRRSLGRHGQLTAVVAFEEDDTLEVVDGFKRYRAARQLGWTELRIRVLPVGRAAAIAAMGTLHEHTGLTPLEEGWMVRVLHREHGLSQGAVGHLLSRHQSWVSRRLMLVESLDEAVQADVRLGLLSARAAMAVAALSRGHQQQAAEVVMRRGMTSRQAEAMVMRLRQLDSDGERETAMRHWGEGPAGPSVKPSTPRAAAELMRIDIASIQRASARLQARLRARPLGALGPDAAEHVACSLGELADVLTALASTIGHALESHKELCDVELAHA